MSRRPRDTVRPFGDKKSFTLVRQSEVIFVELMGSNITYLEHLVRGVVEHPKSDPCAEGVPGARPGCGFRAVFHVPIRDIRVGRDL